MYGKYGKKGVSIFNSNFLVSLYSKRIHRNGFEKISGPPCWKLQDLPEIVVDTEEHLEVAYTCNVFTVSDSPTSPDIGTSLCHFGIFEHFEIWGLKK